MSELGSAEVSGSLISPGRAPKITVLDCCARILFENTPVAVAAVASTAN